MNEVEGFHERWSVSAQIEEPCEMISKVKRNFVDCLRSFDESVLQYLADGMENTDSISNR